MTAFPWQPNMTPTLGPTWQQTTLHAQSRSDLSSSAGPSTDEICVYCEETNRFYRFTQGSAATVDNINVIATNGSGTPGQWVSITNGAGPALWFETLADMAAAPGPAVKALAWCAETDAPYEWFPGVVTAVDGWTIVGNTGGTNGRWVLEGDYISIAPRGGGLDDWPRLIAGAATALVGKGITLRMRAGTWLALTLQSLPAGGELKIIGAGVNATRVVSSIPSVGTNAPFVGQTQYGAAGVLAGTPTVYGKTFTSTLSVAVGSWVLLSNATNAALYQIVNKAGGPVFTYTVERSILRTFLIGDNVTSVTSLFSDIEIAEMTISAASAIVGGVRGINLLNTVRCRVRDILFDGSGGGFFDEGLSFDTASLRPSTERVRVEGGGITRHGILNEGCEDYLSVDDSAYGVTSLGLYVMDLFGGTILNFSVSASQSGVYIGGQGGGSPGSNGVSVFGGGAYGCVANGYQLGLGQRNQIIGAEADGCSNGFDVGAGEAVTNCGLVRCVAKLNTNYNYWARSIGATITECVSEQGQQIGLVITEGVFVSGFISKNDGPFAAGGRISIYCSAAAGIEPIVIERTKITGAINGVYANTTRLVTVRDSYIEATGNNCINHIGNAGSVVILENVYSTGGGGNGYVQTGAASTLRKYGRVDFSSCAVPFTINAAGFVNSPTGNTAAPAAGVVGEGTLGLNGGAAVAYPFPDIKASDAVKFTRRTAAGVPAAGWTFVITPGTGVAITGTAGDTSVIDVEIG